MGNGLVQTQCVIYIAECAPIAIRGTLLASYAFAYQIGGLTGAIGLQVLQTVSCQILCVIKAYKQSAHALDYKRILLSQWIFTGLFTISWFFMPETACRLICPDDVDGHADHKGIIAERETRSAASSSSRSFTESRSMLSANVCLSPTLSRVRLLINRCGHVPLSTGRAATYWRLQEQQLCRDFPGHKLGKYCSDPLQVLLLIKQRRFLISAAIPLFAQLSGNSVSRVAASSTNLTDTDGERLYIVYVRY
jgi:hypothetical protein